MLYKFLFLYLISFSSVVNADIGEKVIQEAREAGEIYAKYYLMTEGLEDFCKHAKYVPEEFIQLFESKISPQIERAKLSIKKIPNETKEELVKSAERMSYEFLEQDLIKFSEQSNLKISKTAYCVFYDDNREEIIKNNINELKEKYPHWFSNIKTEQSNSGWLLFSTDGHKKSKGLDVQISYPENWLKFEAKAPNIVQTFRENSDEDVMSQCMLMIRSNEFEAKPSEWKQALDGDDFQFEDFLPNNSNLLFAQKKLYDNEPGFLMEYTTKSKYKGIEIFQHVMAHAFFYKKYLISVQCSVSGSNYIEWEISSKYKQLIEVFKDFGNSILLQSKYKEALNENKSYSQIESFTSNEKSNATPISFSPNIDRAVIFLQIMLSILFTWGLGLLIPYVIRYKIVRKPLKNGHAWIVALLQFAFMVTISIALGNNGKHYALCIVSIVSHSILIKDNKDKKVKKNDKKN